LNSVLYVKKIKNIKTNDTIILDEPVFYQKK